MAGKRVLIVDGAKTHNMCRLLLIEEGHFLTATKNERDGLELHMIEPFDLVILDLTSTHQNGFETLVALRRVKWTTKFIAIYNPRWLPVEPVLSMAGHLGFSGAIGKPFSAKKMLAVIKKVLET